MPLSHSLNFKSDLLYCEILFSGNKRLISPFSSWNQLRVQDQLMGLICRVLELVRKVLTLRFLESFRVKKLRNHVIITPIYTQGQNIALKHLFSLLTLSFVLWRLIILLFACIARHRALHLPSFSRFLCWLKCIKHHLFVDSRCLGLYFQRIKYWNEIKTFCPSLKLHNFIPLRIKVTAGPQPSFGRFFEVGPFSDQA